MEVERKALSGDPGSQHELATLLLPFFKDAKPSPERHATSLLAELLALLACNRQLASMPDLPRLEEGEFDGSDDAKIWRAKPLEPAEEEEGELPLGLLLDGLREWLPQQPSLKWPEYSPCQAPLFPVTARVCEQGLFARRPLGVAISDCACSSRQFERAELALLRPAMAAVGLQMEEGTLPLDISRQPMGPLLAVTPSYTEEERVAQETRERFGYKLERHKRVESHIIARGVVGRMQEDMAAYSQQTASSTKVRLVHINSKLEAELLGLCCEGEGGGNEEGCKRALQQIEKASGSLASLQEALAAGQRKELEQVTMTRYAARTHKSFHVSRTTSVRVKHEHPFWIAFAWLCPPVRLLHAPCEVGVHPFHASWLRIGLCAHFVLVMLYLGLF